MNDDHVSFVADESLGYARTFTVPAPGECLTFDESYRRAHLPLIAPQHPQVIAEDAARGYRMGRHRIIYSAVLPVPSGVLEKSPAFGMFEAALRTHSFSEKIDWDLLPMRRDVLHATVCGTLSVDAPPAISDDQRRNLRAAGPFAVELRGLFSGNMNLGRLYFPLYPEQRKAQNMVQAVQAALGRPVSGMYLVGMYNFRDELTVAESAALRAFLAAWKDKPLARWVCDEIWILGARDDLVLDREIAEKISLK